MNALTAVSTAIGLIASIITIYLFAVGLVDTNILPTVLQSGNTLSIILLVFLFYFCIVLTYLFCRSMRPVWMTYSNDEARPFQIFASVGPVAAITFMPVFLVWIEISIALDFLRRNHSIFYDVSGPQYASDLFLGGLIFVGFLAFGISLFNSHIVGYLRGQV